ncbi:MAG: Gfo/Idh/MocA family oxidoreductase [Pirellulaceae bacterium]|nr:Gfo/Idh/MocA family oxidoreductase [Pirellulaceae bacterium]
MNLHQLLQQRAARETPVRVGLIGAGKFGTMFLAQARRMIGLQVVGVAEREPARAEAALKTAGWAREAVVLCSTSAAMNDAARRQQVSITTDATRLIDCELDVVVECTGSPVAGAQHALAAIDAGHHVVMVTVEADVLIGPLLQRRAERAGVVYSLAYGDQPALVCELVDWARTCGFEVVAAGKGTKHRPEYHYSTPDTVAGYYGFTAAQSREVNRQMFNSFLDGTKSAIEMAAVANATGLTPQNCGLQFPPCSVDQLAETLKPQATGGILEHAGTVEVVSCLQPDGGLVDQHLRWGVYVTFAAPTDYVQRCFAEYGVGQDKSGRYAALYRPSHLIGLELGMSVASVALRHEPTGTAREFRGDVAACAKRDLQVGERLDGEGGYTVYGKLLPAQTSLRQGVLPIGLADGAKVVRSISRDQMLCYEDVEFSTEPLVFQLRRELESEVRAGKSFPANRPTTKD